MNKEITTKFKCPFCRKWLVVRPFNYSSWSGGLEYTNVKKFQVGCSSMRCLLELPCAVFKTEQEAMAFAEHIGNTTENNKRGL